MRFGTLNLAVSYKSNQELHIKPGYTYLQRACGGLSTVMAAVDAPGGRKGEGEDQTEEEVDEAGDGGRGRGGIICGGGGRGRGGG